jgi:hypothetical protein
LNLYFLLHCLHYHLDYMYIHNLNIEF